MNEAKKILHAMIEIYENDFLCGYEGTTKTQLNIIFLSLIMYMTRYVEDFRYCSKKECSCSPESGIKQILKDYPIAINETFFGGHQGLTEIATMKQIKDFLNQI